MNHTYRLVWNEAAQRYVPAAESARARGKRAGCRAARRLGTVVLAASVAGAYAGSAVAGPTSRGAVLASQATIGQPLPVSVLPSGGQVTSGNGAITQTGNSTVINQQSQNLAINWLSFSIGAGESVRFNQPNSSAIALNRVVGQDPSEILGTLSANGQVFILNPNGVLFGKSAEVNVSALLASTLNLSDADFQAGHYQLAAGSSPGTVVNQGNLTAAAGGYLALVGPSVSNNGNMKVMSGTVLLAAGNKVSLQITDGSLLSYSIDQGAVNALAQNSQLIQADGGRVFLSAQGADAVSKAVVNNTGIIEAQTVDNQGGVIRLLGDSTVGQVNVAGTLDASAPHGGDGGAIETSAAQVKVADDAHVTTAATTGRTGTWLVDPTDYTIAASGGDITGATLSSELASTNITLASTSGKVSGNGDIFVNDAVSWSANTTLTLTASRNIQINNTVTATGGTAGLVLNYGSGDNYYLNAGGKVTLSGATPSLSIGGTSYTVINSLGVQNDTTSTTLQGINNNLSGNYALGSDISAGATSSWTANQGLTGLMPLGNTTTAFTGKFAGLGHVISNLTINYQNNNDVGLFGVTGTSAVVRDVGLSAATIVGNDYVGPLMGFNQGTILDSYAGGTVNDQHYMGGLVGQNSGAISDSYATSILTSKNKIAGGLVGINNAAGVITASYATGAVTGVNKQLGGLVGENLGTISNSYATGSVGGGSAQMGGLVGDNYGTITNSYSTGRVTVSATTSTVGGLVGQNETGGTVTNSFWDTTTSGWTTSAGGTGMATANMQAQANFTSATTANGSVNPAWDFSSVWQMYSGSTYPLLKGFLKPVIVTASNVSATYTSAVWNGTDTYTCSIGSCSGLSGTITFGGTAASAINVGNYSITPGGLYSSSQQGYAITFVSGQLTITPASLTITGITAANKIYDGTVAAVLSGTAKISPLGSDSANLTLGGTGTGTFSTKNVGTGEAVNVTGYTLSGTAASNYTLVEPTGLTANITPASLVISGLTANNKIYDSTVADTLSGTATIHALGIDNLSLGGTGTAVFSTKNVGTGRAVTVSGYTLSGADAGNYTLVEPSGLTASITPASLVISGLTANSKIYDATVNDTLSGTATISALGTDSVSLGGTGTAVFSTKNVGTGRAVTVSGYTLSGADASNYTLVEPTGLTANITPASLVIGGLTANNKVYDATVADTLSGTASISALGTDSVSLGGTGTAVFSTKNVGTGRAVTVSGYTLSGADASNYTLVEPTGLTANITPASLVISGLTANNKIYDATVTDTLSGTATIHALGTDNLSLGGTGTAVFSTKNVGTGRAVTVSGYTLSGADASNYTLVEPTGLTANITPASLTITGLTANNKIYDATVAETLSGTATISALSTDNVALGGTGTAVFSTKNVGTGRAVTVSGYTLSGADASNYTLVEPTGLTANITPASLTITGLTANNKIYDATVAETLSGTAAISALGTDNVSLGGTGTAVFGSKNVGTGKAVTVSGYTLSGADASNYTLIEPIGLTASITPASLTITGLTANNKIYDATVTDTLSGTATVSALGTDVVSLGGTGTATFASKNVGTAKAVTVSGYTLSGADAGNYTLIQPTGLTANITAASLTITGLTANNKVYDATVTDTLSGTATVSALGTDNVSLGGTGTAVFSSKNVGTGKAVTVSGYTLSGADASNYTLIEPIGLTASITPASLTISGLTANNKVYDATVSDTLSGTATVSALGTDNVSLGGTGTAVFGSKNVGTGKTVTVSGYTLSGADASNYTLVEPTGLTANITPASLTITGLTANSKVYDTTVTDTLSGTATISALGTDVVSLGGTSSAVFASKNVGTGKAVTVSGYTLSGADAGNYTLIEPTGLTANITPASLTITGLTANNKVYDTTVTDTLSGTATVSALGNDVVSLGGTGTAAFASKNVGTGKAVTVSGYTLSGADAGNYTLIEPTGLTANITAASLTVTGLTANNKVYDATTGATLSGTATVSALGSDVVSLGGTGTATFASKNVGTGNAVTVNGYTLTGTDAGNYTLIEPTGLTANITPANLVLSGLIANNKVYDATTSATVSGTAGVTALGADSVSLTGTGSASFADKNAGTGKVVTLSGYSLSGTDAGNYVLVQPTGLTANISPANLVISGLTASNKVYDTTVADTLSGTAAVSALGNDAVSLGGTGSAVFASKNVGTGKAVTVSGYTLSGADAANYTLVEPTGLTASITPASLTISGVVANNKVYDTTLTASLSGTATVAALGSDNVVLSGSGSAVFADKNVGNNKAVTVGGYSLSGGDAANYTLVEPTGLTANITPASLTVTGLTANNKVYDTTVTATLSGTAIVNPLGNDVVSVVGTGTGAFANKNVGSDKVVTVSGYSLSGTDAGNYTLNEPTGLSANIVAANLVIGGVTANNKIYDTTTSDTLSGTASVTGLGSDKVSLAGTGVGAFASKNVGTAKAVTVAGFTLTGADAGNYTLIEPTGLTASITPASLAVTGVTATSKVYDATLTANLSGTATVAALGSDNVVLSGGGSGSFADKNVGNNKAVTVSGYTLSGADAANYTLIGPTGLTANITPASLLVSGITANNKVYDTTATETLSGTAIVSPLGNDNVTVSGTGVSVFSDKNAGLNKAVTVSGYKLSGTDAGNYTLIEPTGLTANISAANLTVSGLTAANKVYDGTVAATLSGTAFVVGFGNDTVNLGGTGSGTFTNKNVGTNKTVNISGFSLSGADAANYTLVEPTNVTANITARPLTIGATGINKTYDGTTSAAVTLTDNRVAGDSLVTGYTSAAFADANVGIGKAVSVSGISLTGTDASNYTFNTSAGTTANITAALLTITANAASKTYDGSAYSGGNGITFSGFVAGQTPSVLGGALTYGGSSQGAINVGSYNIVPGGFTSSNYAITFVNGILTISATGAAQAAINAANTLYAATNTLLQ